MTAPPLRLRRPHPRLAALACPLSAAERGCRTSGGGEVFDGVGFVEHHSPSGLTPHNLATESFYTG